jgi:hypothetical protein
MEEQDIHPQLTSVSPRTGIKWSGILWIAGIALVACLLFIAFILSCYAVSQLPGPKTTGAVAPVVLGSGDIEIQVQYYAPGNSVTAFTVTARVSSYQYLAYPGGLRVLVVAPFSYVFNKIPQASQVSFSLVNPSPRIPQLAGLQGIQAMTSSSFRVTGSGGFTSTQYSVVMNKNVVVQFLPFVISSMTTPYTLTLQDEIRFVVGIQTHAALCAACVLEAPW